MTGTELLQLQEMKLVTENGKNITGQGMGVQQDHSIRFFTRKVLIETDSESAQ